MKAYLLFLPILLLTACGVVKPYTPEMSSSSAEVSSSSSEAPAPVATPVSFTNLVVHPEADWWTKSNAIILSRATGSVEFTITRLPGMNSDFTALGVYVMTIDGKNYEEPFGTRTRYIDSKFKYDRYIAPNAEDFNTLGRGTITRAYPLTCIPATPDSTGNECINVAEMLADGKQVVLGFLPSNNLVSYDIFFGDSDAKPYRR